jgi:hypothetical protein
MRRREMGKNESQGLPVISNVAKTCEVGCVF